MKKIHLLSLIVILTLLFAGADYWINGQVPASSPASFSPTLTPSFIESSYPNLIEKILSETQIFSGYQLTKRSRVQHLFETIALDSDPSFVIFYNRLTVQAEAPIEFYEIHGPSAQGNLTYFKIKRQFLQKQTPAGVINEVGSYGQNSFFYNDPGYPKTAFLVVQVNDIIYGIKYNKESQKIFEQIKKAIQYFMEFKKTSGP
ncbi:hypothetical protein HZA43_03325 [Candidatus Peregrinibacteria bacterium]|nr:hypothetical protein [Candidatus Peregrinibacteria bacterium]